MRVTLLGSPKDNFFTSGGVELFDLAAQGRIDAFFLGGGQIDGQGNINLVGTGRYPATAVRWPGSFGSAYLYFLVPRVILFREEHTRRVMVPNVDFISAPGVSEARRVSSWRTPRVAHRDWACFPSTVYGSASGWKACTPDTA
jgi:glutaconate CoA-transferase subunit B